MASLVESRSRMFQVGGKSMVTWNVFVGCDYLCTYCNARKAALTRLKHSPRYRDGFKPHLVEKELSRKFKPGDFVFVGYMGDISFASRSTIIDLCQSISAQPEVNFLFCTKNPSIYLRWQILFPGNLYLGATIETNFDYGLSQAPSPLHRFQAMKELAYPHKFISMEPLMEFHLRTVVDWMKEIDPEIIEIGADNYHNHLPEPKSNGALTPWKVRWLLDGLREFCPTVVEKGGLERLKQEVIPISCGTFNR
ncbi:hypothetical protein LCGC14_1231290 [marine sediment metagenome]|uniref:Radical SAM core domain-containing protein n=1 Tax=marine sediment metagenome TaxID=412755 RepID=A0A0F9LVN4_9ZZZZ